MGFYPNEGDVDANGAEEVNLRTAAGVELLGQQTSAVSLPVVIASNQSAVPVSGTVTANQGSPAAIANSWLVKLNDGVDSLAINSDGSINTVITVGGTVKTVQITYNPPTIGDQAAAVVAAVVGKKIRVYSATVSLGINSSNIFLRNGAGGTQLSVLYLRTTGGSVPSFYYQEATFGTFLFETSVNTALVCNSTTTTGPVSIQIVYSEV